MIGQADGSAFNGCHLNSEVSQGDPAFIPCQCFIRVQSVAEIPASGLVIGHQKKCEM